MDHQHFLMLEVAGSMNNNGVRLFRDGQFNDAQMIFKNSLSLLHNVALFFMNNDEVLSTASSTKTAVNKQFGAVLNVEQPIEVPIAEPTFFKNGTSCHERIAALVLYNVYLLFRTTKKTAKASRLLELVHSVVQPSSKGSEERWHPTFRMVLQYHYGVFQFECGETNSALRTFMEAIQIGIDSSQKLLNARLWSHIGGILMTSRHFSHAQLAFEEASQAYNEYLSSSESDYDEVFVESFTAAAA